MIEEKITGLEPALGTMPVLCYVENATAYFTTCPIARQWGDDWNDAPYEHNAGTPYEYSAYMEKRGIVPYEIVRLIFVGPYFEPYEGHYNSPYSVEQINQGATPWLRPAFYAPSETKPIFAGTTLPMFRHMVAAADGFIFDDVDDAFQDWPKDEYDLLPSVREYWLYRALQAAREK